MVVIRRYVKNVLIGIDQLVNAVAGGDPDETISSRLGKHYRGSWLERHVNALFGKDHCVSSIEPDEGKDRIID